MNKENEFSNLKISQDNAVKQKSPLSLSLLSAKRFLKTCFLASITSLIFLFSFVSCKQEKHIQPDPDYLQGIEVKENGYETVIDGQVICLDDVGYDLDDYTLSFCIDLNPSNLDYSSIRAANLLDNLEFAYDYDVDFWEIVYCSYPCLSSDYYISPGSFKIKPKNNQVHGETSLRFKATDKRTNDIFEITCKVKFIHHPDGAYFEELVDEMPVGSVSKLNVNIIDSYPELVDNSNIIWSSSDESILTVDQTGKIQAVGAGVATITASLEDQEYLKYHEQEYGKDYAENLYPQFYPSCIITVSNALKFESDSQFTLSVIDELPTFSSSEIVTWGGEIDYYDESTFNKHSGKWSEWSGKDKVIQSFENKVSGKYEIYIRGENNNRISGIRNHFKLNGSDLVYCIGDIRALLNYNDVESSRMDNRCFEYLFYNNDLLASCPDLPIKNLASFCYQSMFEGCSSLITPPTLPAITLKDYCYECMFLNCTSLKKCPALPAKNLEWECYNSMFAGCTSLEELPSLEGTTVSSWCCKSMFSGCTLIKVSINSSDEYKYEYKLSDLGSFSNQSYYFPYKNMFKNTGGDVVEDDVITSGMTLYTCNKIIYPEED